MSHSHQDQTAARQEPALTANASHLIRSALASGSTPAKKKHGPDLPYASSIKSFDKVRYQLGKEMNGRWLGAMPVDTFLDQFVPAAHEPLPDLADDAFKNMPSEGVESKRYDHFIAAIREWTPHLEAVNTSTKGDTVNKVNLKTDISLYNRVEGMAPPDRTDFSRMELWIEFKSNREGAAFQDAQDDGDRARFIKEGSFTPDTVKGNMARGQLAHYAGAHHSMQFRHFSFSVAIEGDHARLLRWDPSGTIVTAGFNYHTESRLMGEFLWRFDHLSAEERGHDGSIQAAELEPEVDGRVRERLGIMDDGIVLYRYEVPGLDGMGWAYGPRPPTQNRSLVSRCTRSLPVVWIPNGDANIGACSCREDNSISKDEGNQKTSEDKIPWSEERVVYMKDTWRFLSNLQDVEVMPEHEIYEILHRHGTPNIPEHVVGGDVEGGRTRTQELLDDATWLCVKARICPYQHYRLVHGIVGRPLFKFECTKQLVTAVFDALQAHSHAVNSAQILHRDISAGNIILTDEGRGLLIDWELAKKMDEGGRRRPDRTGTWQFMSANLLQNPGKLHTVTDDLESFLHVLGWTTLRYVPAADSYSAVRRGRDLRKFDECYEEEGDSEEGGDGKGEALGRGSYPSVVFRPRTRTPLSGLLTKLSGPFKSLYAVYPPTDEDRKKLEVPKTQYDESRWLLSAVISQYDKDISCLQSSTWFTSEIKKALDEQEWPTDDKGDVSLPIMSSMITERQMQAWTSQLQMTHSILESSRGLSSGSKRAASPTPEPSAKRFRGASATLGSGV